jgi:hypothetical protein
MTGFLNKAINYRAAIFLTGILAFIAILGSSCSEQTLPGNSEGLAESFDIPYDLSNPDEKIYLPAELTEISGIELVGPGQMACVQDELGKIYFFDLRMKSISRTVDFGKKGDYEDLVISDSMAYILRSDGVIFKVAGIANQDLVVSKIKTSLNRTHDTEGLCPGPDGRSLWIVCKGNPGQHDQGALKGKKAVYRFDLAGEIIDPDPVVQINLKIIEDRKNLNLFTRFSANVGKRLGMIGEDWVFQPSAIDIHPLDGNVYVLSHINKTLLVIDSLNRYSVNFLDPGLFRQPEGITFSPSGDLYISNEGAGGRAVILMFKRNN